MPRGLFSFRCQNISPFTWYMPLALNFGSCIHVKLHDLPLLCDYPTCRSVSGAGLAQHLRASTRIGLWHLHCSTFLRLPGCTASKQAIRASNPLKGQVTEPATCSLGIRIHNAQQSLLLPWGLRPAPALASLIAVAARLDSTRLSKDMSVSDHGAT